METNLTAVETKVGTAFQAAATLPGMAILEIVPVHLSEIFQTSKTAGDFFILLKGDNAGKVSRVNSPNSIGIVCNRIFLVPDYAYYLFTYLHTTGIYRKYLKGSVIPYIRLRDIYEVFGKHISNQLF